MTIRRGDYTDFADVVRVLTMDLAMSALSEHALPRIRDRHRVWAGHLSDVVMAALRTGYVDIADRGGAVAVWQPHLHPVAVCDDAAITAASVSPIHHLRALDNLAQAAHPAQAHTDLVHLAVHPDWRNHGLPEALLHHRLNVLDDAATLTTAHAPTDPGDPMRHLLNSFGYTTDLSAHLSVALPVTVLARLPHLRRPAPARHPPTDTRHQAPYSAGPFNWRDMLR